jgi:hypothetical protein
MKKISLWAKHHPWSARITIVVSFIILNGLGFTTGLLLHNLGIDLPVATIVFFIVLYAGGFIYYPFKNKKKNLPKNPSYYIRQKTCDILLAGSTYLMIVYFGNHQEMLFQYSLPFNKAMASNSITPKDSTAKSYKSIAEFSKSMKDENGKALKWKERKKLLKEQVRAIRHSKETSEGGKTVLIILSVLAALLLISLVASLACSLSCAGSDVAAVLVGVGGTALIIWLLIVVIRRITGKKKITKEPARSKNAMIPETSLNTDETS